MTNDELREQLILLADPKYQKFTCKLIPNIPSHTVLGIRLPQLRKLAKTLAKGDFHTYLEHASDESFEEVMLQGMVIGYLHEDFYVVRPYLERFIPKINNWSVCDSFVSGLKLTKRFPEEMWDFINPYLLDTREYFIRFGIVMLLFYYVDEEHIDQIFLYFDQILLEDYYVKMAVAWAVSICYVSFPSHTLEYLKRCPLDDFTYNKALQKITESLQVDRESKVQIRGMKRSISMSKRHSYGVLPVQE